MKQIIRNILITAIFLYSSYQASFAWDYTVGKWRFVIDDSNGKTDIYNNGTLLIGQTYFACNANGSDYWQDYNFTINGIHAVEINDEFGSGTCIYIESTNNGITAKHSYYIYGNSDYFLTDLTLSSGGELSSNYMAPIRSYASNVNIVTGSGNRALKVPFHNDDFVRYGSNNFSSGNSESSHMSYEVGAFYNESSRKGLILGSVEHTTWKTAVTSKTRNNNRISYLEVYGGHATKPNSSHERVTHGQVKGTTVKSPKIFVGYYDDWRDGMEAFGDANATVAPKYKWSGRKPFGWNSWAVIETELNFTNATESADWMYDNLQVNGFSNDNTLYVGLDSYWDWQMNANQLMKIPQHYKTRNNQKAGIYTASHCQWGDNPNDRVGSTQWTYGDLYLKYNGQPQKYDNGTALDPTHPGTKAIVEDQINKFLMWGYRYIKIDFMCHPALEADSYYDPNVTTGMQAYNYALKHFTDYLQSHPMYPKDEEVFLNLSIAPVFPANYTHSRRISCDTWNTINWTEYELNSLTYGWWLDHAYSYNDADHIKILGANENENRSRITSSVITGIVILGDDYSSTGNASAKEITKRLMTNTEIIEMARRSKAFRPVNSASTGENSADMFMTKIGDITYVALINYGSSNSNKTVDLSRIGLTSGSRYVMHELWGNTINDNVTGNQTVSVAGKDAKILKIYPYGTSGQLPALPDIVKPTPEPDPIPNATPAVSQTHSASAPSPNWEVIKNTSNGLPMTATGRLIWGDYNNDGYLDAFMFAGQGKGVVALYRNNGDNTFTTMPTGEIVGLSQGSALFLDYDNDGNLDLVTVGNSDGANPQGSIFLYKNSGAPDYTFTVDRENTINLVNGKSGDNNAAGRMLEAVDFDHDGWIDLIETADLSDNRLNDNNWRLTAYYKNNKGVFERKTDIFDGQNIIQACGGSVHVGDINKDGYADIVTVGYGDGIGFTANLYVNNQNGTFSRSDYSSQLSGGQKCEMILTDINGDGYDDIVEIAWDKAIIHVNNGNGTFTKHDAGTTGLRPSEGASITAGDVNNDGKIDLFVTGYGAGLSVIYYNNGDLTFTAVEVPDVTKARNGNANLMDIDRDGNLDFSTFGYGLDWSNSFVLNKLGNDIAANEPPSVPSDLTVAFNDGKFSLRWIESVDKETPQSALRYNIYAKDNIGGKIYTYAPVDIETGRLKTGGGIVPLISGNSFEWILPDGNYTFGVQAVDQSDFTSDFNVVNYPEGHAQWAFGGSFPADWVTSGRMIWGDYNNDGRLDVFYVAGQGGGNAALFMQNADGSFTRVQENVFVPLNYASAVFMDYNNDGHLDLVTVGETNDTGSGRQRVAYVYRNTGESGNYAYVKDEERSAELPGIASGSNDGAGRMLNAIDYDNDGWVDLIMCGQAPVESVEGGWRLTAVFRNNGGSFERKNNIVDGNDFTHVAGGSVHVGDVNNDGFADIFIQGYRDKPTGGWNAYLYINNQDGTFSESWHSDNFIGGEKSETVFVDINGDGCSDIVEVAWNAANIYLFNSFDNTFTKYDDIATGLQKSEGVSITAGDINNDGYIDLLMSGLGTLGTKIFYNNGNGTFTPAAVPDMARARAGNVSLADIDGDGNLDFSNFGYRDYRDGFSPTPAWVNTFMLNNIANAGISANTPPAAPDNFSINYGNGCYMMVWDKSYDAETPEDAIRYNVFALNEDDDKLYMYSPADLMTGKLKTANLLSLIQSNNFTLNLPEGNYMFGVQAVDLSDVASPFTTERQSRGVETGLKSVLDNILISSSDGSIRMQNNLYSDVNYTVMTVNGQIVNKGTLTGGTTRTVSSGLSQGIYIVVTENGDAVRVAKISVL